MEKPSKNIYVLKLQLQIEQSKRLLSHYRHEIAKGKNLKMNMILNGVIGITDIDTINFVCNNTDLEMFDLKLQINDLIRNIGRSYVSIARINLNEKDLTVAAYEKKQERISTLALKVDMRHEENRQTLIHDKKHFTNKNYSLVVAELKENPMQMLMMR